MRSSPRTALTGRTPKALSIRSVTGISFRGYVGRSISYRLPFCVTVSGPLRVLNRTVLPCGSKKLRMTKADARVACPHSSTSVPGVNQRRRYPAASFTMNAVSDRLFSIAKSDMAFSDGQLSITQTAAGLPEKGLSVKASTMYCFIIFQPPCRLC